MNSTFTKGKILYPLLKFTIPIFIALFIQAMYGAIDLLIVGQFSSAEHVSAVATGSQIMQTITSVIVGLAMGVTILLARKIGEQKKEEAGYIVGAGIYLFGVITIIVSILMVVFASPITQLMQAPKDAFDASVSYVTICSMGAIFIVSYNLLGSVFRGIGDSFTPLIAVCIACIFNIVGDYILVAIYHMASSGAAIATVVSQGISVLLCLFLIKKRGLPFKFHKSHIRFNKQLIMSISKLGIPIALQDLLVSISFLAIMAIVNSLGVIASAGVGVAEKICAFIMLIPSSYMQALSAFVGQNIGAKEYKRADKALLYACFSSFLISVLIAYFSFFHGNVISQIFTNDSLIIQASSQYLKAYAIDVLLVSFLFCFNGYFNGRGETRFVMIQGIIGAFCIRIPVSFIMSKFIPVSLFHIGLATPCSTIIQIILCLLFYNYLRKQIY